ncbi:hypothetical protein ACS127_11205 [Amphibacillus sp. Q70]|uniref:hypothetical protein n=1 Tax=Amphibacillus sp. Q70 TaxID=3453416 RepID=UPI003F825D34
MKSIFRSIQYALLEWLALFPFLLWINTLFLGDFFQDEKWIYFPIIYIAAALLGRLVKKNSLKVLIGMIIASSLIVLLSLSSYWYMFVLFVLFLILTLRGFQYGQGNPHGILPLGLIWSISLPSYFISYILYSGNVVAHQQKLLTVFALILLFCLLFLTNREHLSQASLVKSDQNQINRKMKYQNYVYVFIFFIFIFVLTRFNFLASGLVLFLRALIQLLGLFSGEEEITREVEEVEQGMPDFGVTSEPSRWTEIVDWILTIMGSVILIFVLLFALYLVLKRIPFFARKIKILTQKIVQFLLSIRKGRSFTHDQSYQDETESVFDLGKGVDQWVKKLKSRFTRGTSWSNLTDQEKARQLFREVVEEAIRQGYVFHHYETASEGIARLEQELINNEALTEWLASSYNQARYSSLTIAQIEELRAELEREGWISSK